MNEGAKGKIGKKIAGWFGKIFTSKPVTIGLKWGTGATILGGGLYAGGKLSYAGAKPWIDRLKGKTVEEQVEIYK
jgi:hypothetical protein